MKRETGLSGLQQVSEITDALLAFTEAVDDLQARLIGQRVEPTRDPRG